MPINTLDQFVSKWQKSALKERSAAQSHFIELCYLLGQPTPTEDPTGADYCFEKGAVKLGGGDGFADVWLRDHFAWEYKGKHADLKAAYLQLQKYRDDLGNPPLMVVCDLDRFEVHTNWTNTSKRVHAFNLTDLSSTSPIQGTTLSALEVLRAVFTAPEKLHPTTTAQAVTEEAAKEFAALADSLRGRGVDPEQSAQFLMRLLFSLFAEDVGLLPEGLFSKVIELTRKKPDDFKLLVSDLFGKMAKGGLFGPNYIRHFNGGLFTDDEALDLSASDLDVLSRACKLNWGSVEPAIFGTLFERSLDPSKRAQLGAHYTSREDILLIVEPVLMAPLRREWAEVRHLAEELVEKRQAIGTARGTAKPKKGATAKDYNEALLKLLTGFTTRIASINALDPACGSGNFLYVTLRQLLDLEREVIQFSAECGLPYSFPQVRPEQLHGIEINVFAHHLASLTIWLGYIQWMIANGFGADFDPVLRPLDNIKLMDAIVGIDESGVLALPKWPEAEVIVGNPPFLGGKRLRTELGDSYVDDLFALYNGTVPREADLVCYWYETARKLVADGGVKRVGLLATNSIRGGANRKVLEAIKSSGDVFMAWSDRDWVLDGAAVRVSMVGFDDGSDHERTLDGFAVPSINADLTGALDLTRAHRLPENAGLAFQGPVKVGQFELTPEEAVKMLTAPLNVNGRPNSDVVSPWVNGLDVTRRPRGYFIIDFGGRATKEAAQYELPFEHICQYVRPVREQNRDRQRRENWWRLGRSGEDLKAATAALTRFVATPRVAKHRVFAWVDPRTLPDSATIAIARSDDYFLGVLHSKPHELWSLRMGTSLEDRPRYTPTTTFETYPFPWPPGEEDQNDPKVKAISEAATELVRLRDFWLNPPDASDAELSKRTLTNLYNAHPAWLEMAHSTLDRTVFDAYGWPYSLTDEEVLERLLALNLERASKSAATVTSIAAEKDGTV